MRFDIITRKRHKVRAGKYKSKAAACMAAVAFGVFCFDLSSAAQTRTSASAASFRTIVVTTEPGASVWIDGVSYGKTDEKGRITVRTVSPGKHMLRVRADGFSDALRALAAITKGSINITLKKTTDEAELSFQRGIQQSSVDRERAAAAFRNAIRLQPKYLDAYIGLARVLSDGREYENAANVIAEVRKFQPTNAEVSAIEGRILRDGGEEDAAIAAFKRSIREGRGFQPEAYTGLGLIYKERAEAFAGEGEYDKESANYDDSAKYLKTALKQLSGAPDAVVVYQILGLIYEQQKRYTDAIAVYEEFLRVFPDIPESESVASFIVQLKKQISRQ